MLQLDARKDRFLEIQFGIAKRGNLFFRSSDNPRKSRNLVRKLIGSLGRGTVGDIKIVRSEIHSFGAVNTQMPDRLILLTFSGDNIFQGLFGLITSNSASRKPVSGFYHSPLEIRQLINAPTLRLRLVVCDDPLAHGDQFEIPWPLLGFHCNSANGALSDRIPGSNYHCR